MLKSCLDKLELQWGVLSDVDNSQDLERKIDQHAYVLENLQPHENLKELFIQSYCGRSYPHWLHEQSLKFRIVHLQGLKYCNHLPPLGQLPFLEAFYISEMDHLVSSDKSFYGNLDGVKFPSLKSFQVHNMNRLIDWTYEDEGNMPCLECYTIQDCASLISLPCKFQELTVSNITNCPNLQPPHE